MQDAMAVMHKLQTGLDVNVRFTGWVFNFSSKNFSGGPGGGVVKSADISLLC